MQQVESSLKHESKILQKSKQLLLQMEMRSKDSIRPSFNEDTSLGPITSQGSQRLVNLPRAKSSFVPRDRKLGEAETVEPSFSPRINKRSGQIVDRLLS